MIYLYFGNGHFVELCCFDLSKIPSSIFLGCGPPSDVCWFINPINCNYVRIINHSEIGVNCKHSTNLAILWGPHIV